LLVVHRSITCDHWQCFVDVSLMFRRCFVKVYENARQATLGFKIGIADLMMAACENPTLPAGVCESALAGRPGNVPQCGTVGYSSLQQRHPLLWISRTCVADGVTRASARNIAVSALNIKSVHVNVQLTQCGEFAY
jgi:hypothetical protein